MAEERPKGKAEKGTREKASLKRSKHRPIEDVLRGIEDAQRAALLPSTRLFESLNRAVLDSQRVFESLNLRAVLDSRRVFESLNREVLDSQRRVESLNRAVLDSQRRVESLNLRAVLDSQRVFESLNLRAAFASISDWEASLTTRMATLQTQWVLRDYPDQSVIGFARLLRLSDAIHTEEPYSEPVGELVADELGDGVETEQDDSPTARDTAAIEAGLNPALIAFPPDTYNEVVSAAGFHFHLPRSPMPQAIESADPDAVFNPMHGQVMTAIEQQLRKIVEECLKALEGEKWMKRRVPEDMRKRWLERQKEDRQAGRPVYSPIQYADFMDLAHVIDRNDNWQKVFKPIFRDRDDFGVSLRRLHPIRKAIAHSRPLGRSEVLTLMSEATRIFKALRISVLS